MCVTLTPCRHIDKSGTNSLEPISDFLLLLGCNYQLHIKPLHATDWLLKRFSIWVKSTTGIWAPRG